GALISAVRSRRLRSISMNAALYGDLPTKVSDEMDKMIGPSQWQTYRKMSDTSCPGAAMLWVFTDENMCTLEDGYMQVDLNQHTYPNPPASYDCGGNCFSFIDGHGEFKKWAYKGSGAKLSAVGLPSATYEYDFRQGVGNNIGTG